MLSLERVEPGTDVRILQVSGTPEFVERMMEIGLVPGTNARLLRRSPLGGTIQLQVGTSTVALRLSKHHTIRVELSVPAVKSAHRQRALDFVV